MFDPSLYIDELRIRLSNPAILDTDLEIYLISASRQVKLDGWEDDEYKEMILNSACQLLLVDNKFPEITAVQSQGVSTNFAANDPLRFRNKIAALREAWWMRNS